MSIEVSIKKRLGNFLLETEFNSEGGVTGLLGASGCGKSVTLRCIAGIIRPDEGHIAVKGRVLFDSAAHIDLPPQKRRVGYLFQNYALFPNMTVEANIACGAAKTLDRHARAKRVREMMEKMQLKGLEKHRPSELSGGQQQRTALARILAGDPDALLLDEPFSALDSHLRERVISELKKTLTAFGRDAVLVTHSRDEAYQLCDRLALMQNGSIDAFGETRRIFACPETRAGAALTGCKNIVSAQKAGERRVFVPEWGITLQTAAQVKDGLKAIGIRAHYFGNIEENSFHITAEEAIEQPFEWTVRFRYEGQEKNSPSVWWRVAKTAMPNTLPKRLGVSPDDVLLLYR